MSGTLVLVGSGEFLETMRPVDSLLLDAVGGPSLARVVVIPTASAPDGPRVFADWAGRGQTHFAALGAAVDAAPIAERAGADDAEMVGRIAAANVVYLSGGKPGFLQATLRNTRAWEAIRGVYERGGVLAGSSAGAMVLASKLLSPRLRLAGQPGHPALRRDARARYQLGTPQPPRGAHPDWHRRGYRPDLRARRLGRARARGRRDRARRRAAKVSK